MIGLVHPVSGARVSSAFGVDRGNHAHGGVDFAAPNGTPVLAAAAGRVTSARYTASAGNMIILDHGGGFDTRYFHLSSFAVKAGDTVRQGQTIGAVGSTGHSTGNHLHFETRSNGAAVDPLYILQHGAGAAAGASLFGESNGGMMIAGLLFLLAVVLIID